MPKKDGLSVLRQIRGKGDQTPVLLLTAKDSIEDRVAGLDAGANDYLIKPFACEELLARIRVLLRKPEQSADACLRVGDLEIHTDTHQVRDPFIRQRVCAASLYGTECGNRSFQRAAGGASVEL